MESELIACALYLQDAFKACPGDVPKLRDYILSDFRTGKFTADVLHKVFDDNIEACVKAGYANKEKVFRFLKTNLESEQKKKPLPDTVLGSDTGQSNAVDPLSTYHAPKFVDDELCKVKGPSASDIVAPDTFLDVTNASSLLLSTAVKNPKKKSEKKEVKKKAGSIADKIADHLMQHGWAVCDNFIPLELVRRIRIEEGLLMEHFEQSEVWIGKHSDVGAHVSVPSVRGDKVLWMCGGHNHLMSPDGVTRAVQTHGEVEPCKPQVKAAAPVRKFNGIRELMAACDKLMSELKPRVPRLAGVYERSDAMIAVYPGGGARFANHIDNTTKDGRVLTMLIYLNPSWTHEHGGALRITPTVPAAPAAAPAPSAPHCSSDGGGSHDHPADAAAVATAAAAAANPAGGSEPQPPPVGADGAGGAAGRAAAVDVYPTAGRIAMFWSAEMPHEVLPSYGERHAVTFWWYDKDERRAAVTASVDAGRAAQAAAAPVKAQKEAKAFIASLAGGDEVAADGGPAAGGGKSAAAALGKLTAKARGLSAEAADVVASITGAPSGEAFKLGFDQLQPEDLQAMRALFRRMGLT